MAIEPAAAQAGGRGAGPSPMIASLPVAPSPPKPEIAVERLIALDAAEVAGLLGEPAFTRADGPARLLRYRGAACVLDLFLYAADGGFRVRHVEARDRAFAVVPLSACLASVIAARGGAAG